MRDEKKKDMENSGRESERERRRGEERLCRIGCAVVDSTFSGSYGNNLTCIISHSEVRSHVFGRCVQPEGCSLSCIIH